MHVVDTCGCMWWALAGQVEGTRGSISITFGETPMVGVACKLSSPGLTALVNALTAVRGSANPYSICGSLPLVDQLQKAGFGEWAWRT